MSRHPVAAHRYGLAASLGLALWAAVLPAPAAAATEAMTDDGERVRLFDDFTWEYVETPTEQVDEPAISLQLVRVSDRYGHCVIGLRLHNNAPYPVVSLVPQFTGFVREGVQFDTVFVSFQNIMPTLSQYQELKFRHMRCKDITRVQVHGGDRCTMGDLEKYSAARGECLRRVEVRPSKLVEISK